MLKCSETYSFSTFPMPKKLSCGVLVFNEHGQVLLAHVTGCVQWDIPKGTAEPGETPLAAALRETFEETGIVFEPQVLEDLGVFTYRWDKILHLFRTFVDTRTVDILQCACVSMFVHEQTKLSIPEMDGYRWARVEEIDELCAPVMAAALGRAFASLRAPRPER